MEPGHRGNSIRPNALSSLLAWEPALVLEVVISGAWVGLDKKALKQFLPQVALSNSAQPFTANDSKHKLILQLLF